MTFWGVIVVNERKSMALLGDQNFDFLFLNFACVLIFFHAEASIVLVLFLNFDKNENCLFEIVKKITEAE